MKQNQLSLLLFPLLLASCIIGTDPEKSSSVLTSPSETFASSSFDFGSEPTFIYQREDASFVKVLSRNPYRVETLLENGNRFLFGPYFSLAFNNSWVDVKLVGQKDITSGVKGSGSLILGHAYNNYDNDILLDGREFPGVDGEWSMYAYIPENACRNPDECFIRLISHPKDNLDAINGYALAVVYPIGEPVEVMSEEAGFGSENLEGKKPGLVWLDWNIETVGCGVFFPKINGEYQNIDINRVNAALDIMCANAKGHYFNKAQ